MPIEAESPEQFGYDRIRFNLAESSVADTPLRDLDVWLDDLVLMYGDHLGRPGLRAAIAAGGDGLSPDDVLVTPGAAAALFIISTTLLQAGDEVIVARPNYATNLETPRAIGADVRFLDLRHEDGWAVDPDRIASLMTPRTVLVSLTNPHNPTGQVIPEATIRAIVDLVERHPTARLLLDETYREMTFGTPAPGGRHALGAGDQRLLALEGGRAAGDPDRLAGHSRPDPVRAVPRGQGADPHHELGRRRGDRGGGDDPSRGAAGRDPAGHRRRLRDDTPWLAGQDSFEWVEPRGGVVGFPRFRPDVEVDVDAFYRLLLDEHGTVVGPGHWFDQPRRHFRLGYGWPTAAELAVGSPR